MLLDYLRNSKINVSNSEITKLKQEGYVVLKRSSHFWRALNLNLDEVALVCDKLLKKEGDLAGQDGKTFIGKNYGEIGANRLKNLLAKGDCFRKMISVPDILFCCKSILGENFSLSSIDLREPLPNNGYQGLHLDWKQRNGKRSNFFQCTAFVLLDDVNKRNGAIRILPKSHEELYFIKSTSHLQKNRTPRDHMILEEKDKKDAKLILGKKGDIIILNVNSFHGGTENKSGERRRLIHLNYRHNSLPLNINQYKFIPKNLHNNFNEFEKFIMCFKKESILNKFLKFNRKNLIKSLFYFKNKLLK